MTWLRHQFLSLVVLLLSLGVTYSLWLHEQHNAKLDLEANFDSALREDASRIAQRMAAYEQVMRGTQGLFAASQMVGRAEFQRYVELQQLGADFSGIEGIGLHVLLSHSQMQEHLRSMRGIGFPGYAVQPAGEREFYAPLTQLEPATARNLRAIGFDAYSDPERRKAMEMARDSGSPTITGKLMLAMDAGTADRGFLMFMPIYRKGAPINTVAARRAALIGWAAAPFRVDSLMASLYGERAPATAVKIYDGVTMNEDSLLYDSDRGATPFSEASMKAVEYIVVSGRNWTVSVHSLPGFDARYNKDRSRLIAIGGVILSLLLALLTWGLATGRERAHAMASSMTSELRHAKEHFELIFNGSPDAAIITRMSDGLVVDVNESFCTFSGYTRDMAVGRDSAELHIWGDLVDRENIVRALRENGACQNYVAQLRRADGGRMFATISATIVYLRGQPHIIGVTRDITKRVEVEERLNRVLKGTNDGWWEIDLVNRSFSYSDRWWGMLGYANKEEAPASWKDVIYPEDRAWLLPLFESYVADPDCSKYEEHFRELHKNGHPVPVLTRGFIQRDDKGNAVRVSGSTTDITGLKRVEQELREAKEHFELIFNSSPDGTVLSRLDDGCIVNVNRGFTDLTGYRSDEVIGHAISDLRLWKNPEDRQAYLLALREKGCCENLEAVFQKKDGSEIFVIASAQMLVQKDTTFVVGVMRDITERKITEQRIARMAQYDGLTDLPNRALLSDRLQQALAQAKRNQTRLALVFLDLDNFKPINDTLGHHVGDLLLKAVARRMQDCVRKSDTVARIGGDEFVVLLPLVDTELDALEVAEKIRDALNRPFDLVGSPRLTISSSAGVAVYPDHGTDGMQLSRNADDAMYRAKERGRNQVQLFG